MDISTDMLVGGVVVLCACCSYVLLLVMEHQQTQLTEKQLSGSQPITDIFILVTAHPDDESMFFVPTIRQLSRNPTAKLGIVCLSSGNYDGLGDTRKDELMNCCQQTFGFSKEMIRIVEHPELQDGPNSKWPENVVSAVALENINGMLTDAGIHGTSLDQQQPSGARVHILTFDSGGVSGHPNHIAVFRGMCRLKMELESKITVHQLLSVPLLYKYIGHTPALVLWFQHKRAMKDNHSLSPLVVSTDMSLSYRAMSMHYSQFVWFRRAFVLSSWYTFFNTWEEISGELQGT